MVNDSQSAEVIREKSVILNHPTGDACIKMSESMPWLFSCVLLEPCHFRFLFEHRLNGKRMEDWGDGARDGGGGFGGTECALFQPDQE